MKLRDYQERAVSETIKGFNKSNKQLIVLPTGSGKTFVIWNIIKRLGVKAVVFVNTKEILQHTIATGEKHFPELQDRAKVSTIQSAMYTKKLAQLSSEDYELIIVDECHHSAASSYRKILDTLNVKDKRLIGCTATPFRKDGQSIYDLFGQPNFTMTIEELIEMGYLCDLQGYRIMTNCSLAGVRKQKGDFQRNQLESVINTKNRNLLIVNEYLKLAPGEQAIAFCVSVKHAFELREEFLARGVYCEVIHGGMKDTERKGFLKLFERGKIEVLANCQILTEGFDAPYVRTLLMARPTCSKTLYTQMIGRGARTFPGKDHCKVLEFTDNNFSVFDLSQCYDERNHNKKMDEGETFSHFVRRIKDLPEGELDTRVEKINVIPKFFSDEPATLWQINELKRRNIKFPNGISEMSANYLLAQG